MMNNIRQIPFKKEHLEIMDIREREYKILADTPDFVQKLTALENFHSAMTFIHKGIVLGVVGYIPVNPGTCEVWLIPSSYVSEYSLAFARLLRYYRKEIMPTFNWHRLQMVAPNDELHNRWAEFLGFEKEGILRQWGHNKADHVMWSIVR